MSSKLNVITQLEIELSHNDPAAQNVWYYTMETLDKYVKYSKSK